MGPNTGQHHRRVEELRRRLRRHVAFERTKNLTAYIRDEQEDLVAALFELVGQLLDTGRIERSLAATNRIDFDTLMLLVARLDELPLQDWAFTWASGRECNPAANLNDLRHILEATQDVSEKARLLEVLLRLELAADRKVEKILVAIPPDEGHVFKQWLVDQLESKLGILDDRVVMDLWGRLKAEFGRFEDDDSAMQPVPGILDPSFLELRTPAEARSKIASYLVKLRPQLIRALEAKGQTQFAVVLFGVARLLALSGDGPPLDRADSTFATSVMRLATLWTTSLHQDRQILRGQLRLQDPEGRLTQGPFYEEESEKLKELNTDDWTKVLGEEGEKVLDRIDALIAAPTPAEDLLLRHKLALEVMAPENIAEIERKKETRLQAELCRFLIEHGVFSVGTQFGRSETDLVARHAAGALVIEIKKTARVPSAHMIRQWLIQLQSYMDQEPVQVDGVLLIYNLSSTLIVAPRQRLLERYRVVAINLLKPAPSKRRQSIEIIESKSDSLVEVLREAGEPIARKKKATKKTVTKKTAAKRR